MSARLSSRLRALTISVALAEAVVGCWGTPHVNHWYQNSVVVSPPDAPQFTEVAWSPDGNLLALSSAGLAGDTTGSGDLFTIDLTSGALSQVTSTVGTVNAHPVWSPAGDRIAFYSNAPQEGIWTVYPSGTDMRFLADGRIAAWAPSGGSVAVVQVRMLSDGGGTEAVIAIVNVYTNLLERVVSYQANVIAPGEAAWSPTGEHIALLVREREVAASYSDEVLYDLEVTTAELRELTRGRIGSIQWIDADTIFYAVTGSTLQPEKVELRMLDLTGDCHAVVLAEGPMSSLHLSPSGTTLAYIGSQGAVYLLDIETALGHDFWSRSEDCD